MKRFSFILILVFFPVIMFTSCADTNPWLTSQDLTAFAAEDDQTGIRFPDKLAGVPFQGIIDYEQKHPGWGKDYKYSKAHVSFDIYIYNAGIEVIPDGIESNEIYYAFQDSKKDIQLSVKNGEFAAAQLINEDVITAGAVKLLHAHYRIEWSKSSGYLHILMTGFKNQIIKVYYYIFAFSQGNELFGKFISEFGNLFKRIPIV